MLRLTDFRFPSQSHTSRLARSTLPFDNGIKQAKSKTDKPTDPAITSSNTSIFPKDGDNSTSGRACALSLTEATHQVTSLPPHPPDEEETNRVNVNYSTQDQDSRDPEQAQISSFISSTDRPALCRILSCVLFQYLYTNEPRTSEDCYQNLLHHPEELLITEIVDLVAVHKCTWKQFQEKFLQDVPKKRSQSADIKKLVERNAEPSWSHPTLITEINSEEELYPPKPPPDGWMEI